MERLKRILEEDEPILPNYDEGQLAIDRGYAHRNFAEQIRLYRAGRAKIMEFVRVLPDDAWQRTGNRPEIGQITIEALATLITLHDNYHVRQMLEWLNL